MRVDPGIPKIRFPGSVFKVSAGGVVRVVWCGWCGAVGVVQVVCWSRCGPANYFFTPTCVRLELGCDNMFRA